MLRDIIKQVIIDQREMYLSIPIVKRHYELEDNINYCFVGIRRTGKSYMMYQQIHRLINRGIPDSNIVYINFEDERLLEFCASDFNTLLEIGLELAGGTDKPYLFLDEVQNIAGWEKFARRMADAKYHINITGSNSRMLSREMASTLGGRFMIMHIFPYSFDEYITALPKKIKISKVMSTKSRAELINIYNQYITYGAFPELLDIKNKRDYLNSIYQTIYVGDIIARNKINNEFGVRLLIKKLAEALMHPISFNRLANILKAAGISIGKQTVINYIGYIVDAYLIFPVQNYAAKLVDKETAPKYYFMDTGLIGLLMLDCDTARLENLIAIELYRRYGIDKIFYFNRNVEIDFVIPDEKLAIQVCYNLSASIDTRDREIGALAKLHNYFPEYKYIIITNSEEQDVEINGMEICIIPAWKWLIS